MECSACERFASGAAHQANVPCNKAVCIEAVCSFVTPFYAACTGTHRESVSRSSTTESKFRRTN